MLIYWLVIASAIAQFAGWIILVRLFVKNKMILKANLARTGRHLLLLSAIALTAKLLLQVGSTHPALSQLAFGFRPIVIGYLHLVLLGVITLFIIGHVIGRQLAIINKLQMTGVWIFVAGIIINEILLMMQGIMGLSYVIVPYINELLLAAAMIMFCGLLLLLSRFRHSTALPG